MIFGIMKRELSAIVYLGALLGFIMGFVKNENRLTHFILCVTIPYRVKPQVTRRGTPPRA